MENKKDDKTQGRLAEYATLRDEILSRIRMRNQILVFTMVVLGIVLSLGGQEGISPIVFFLYPILAVFLALRWAWIDLRVMEIGDYIRTKIEPHVPGMGWEGHMHTMRTSTTEKSRLGSILRPTELSAIGLFLGAGILAGALGITKSALPLWDWIFVVCDILAIIATFYILRMRTRRRNKKKESEDQSKGKNAA